MTPDEPNEPPAKAGLKGWLGAGAVAVAVVIGGVGGGYDATASASTDDPPDVEAGEVVAVPTAAVNLGGGRATVRVVEGDDARDVEITIGDVGSTWTEITAGLTAGQHVVLSGPHGGGSPSG